MSEQITELKIRQMGCRSYRSCWEEMRRFTDTRTEDTPDELWLLEHPPVYTLGQAASEEHVLDAGDIEVVRTDRGGQVTYHGPGQLMGYLLIDVRRRGWGVRRLVRTIESALVGTLADFGIDAEGNDDARGVYVGGRKIASLGLRLRKGCSYHGFALNVSMDLGPFAGINPCGFTGLEVTQVADLVTDCDRTLVEAAVRRHMTAAFGYDGRREAENRT